MIALKVVPPMLYMLLHFSSKGKRVLWNALGHANNIGLQIFK